MKRFNYQVQNVGGKFHFHCWWGIWRQILRQYGTEFLL